MKRLAFLALFICTATFAQDAPLPSPKETRELDYAKQAFYDKIYDNAQKRLEKFLDRFPSSPLKDEADWLLGQSYFFQGRYTEALKLFQKTAAQKEASSIAPPLWELWEAETLFALERWDEAKEKFSAWIQAYPEHPNLSEAKLGLANVLFQQGKKNESLDILSQLSDLKQDTHRRANLLRAKILLANANFDEAQHLLEKLAEQKLDPPLLFEVHYWLAETYRRQGDNKAAQKHYQRILDDKRASPKNIVALAWLGQGDMLHTQEKWPAATNAYQRAFQLAELPSTTLLAMQRFLETHRANNSLTTGAIELRTYAKNSNNPAALYAIAKNFHQAGNIDAAITELDNLIQSYPKTTWAMDARILMSEFLAETGQRKTAIDELRPLVENDTFRTQDALLLSAELYFKEGNFTQSAELYRQAAQSRKSGEQLEQALYNALLAFSRAKRMEEFSQTEEMFVERFPESPRLPQIFLEKARLLLETGETASARVLLQEIINRFPKSEFVPEALFTLASSLYRDVDYAGAAREFKRLETLLPQDHPLAVKTHYYNVLSQHRAGQIDFDTERQQLLRLLESHIEHELAPDILFQVGQTYYEQQNFGDAEKTFQTLANNYPDHPLANQAIYYTGKSLMWLGKHELAIETFEKIPEPSPLKAEARLAEIDAYRQLGKFEAALKIADSLAPPPPQDNSSQDEALSPLQLETLLRKANVLFTLAGDKPDLYNQTIQTTERILQSPLANTAQRNESGFVKGKSLEKLGRQEEALQAYLDVVYGKLLPQMTGPAQPEYRWFTRSGVEAAQIKEQQGDIAGAISIYKILERLSGPNREEFSKKIEDLRTRHFIWE